MKRTSEIGEFSQCQPTEVHISQNTVSGKHTSAGPSKIISILLVALMIVQAPKVMALLTTSDPHFRLLGVFISILLMSLLPFTLRYIYPTIASFDSRLLPQTKTELWPFILLVLTVLAWGKGIPHIASHLKMKPDFTFNTSSDSVSTTIILLSSLIIVFTGPVAEEIFWRGWLQKQFDKFLPKSASIFLQALLFAFAHLQGLLPSIIVFGYGIAFGFWRHRYKSMLPLILAHIILNAIISIPMIRAQYTLASYSAELRSNPQIKAIDSLVELPAQESIPQIIEYFRCNDEMVKYYSIHILATKYGREGKDHFRNALLSGNKQVILGILDVLSQCKCRELNIEVRNLIYTSTDTDLQISAVVTLERLGDAEGLKDIESNHSSENIREKARRLLMLNQRLNKPDADTGK